MDDPDASPLLHSKLPTGEGLRESLLIKIAIGDELRQALLHVIPVEAVFV